MARTKGGTGREEVVLEIPDLGLTTAQLGSLKKAFKNELVSTMGEGARARARIIVVRIRIVRLKTEV